MIGQVEGRIGLPREHHRREAPFILNRRVGAGGGNLEPGAGTQTHRLIGRLPGDNRLAEPSDCRREERRGGEEVGSDFHVLKQWPANKVARKLGVSLGKVYFAKYKISRLLKKE